MDWKLERDVRWADKQAAAGPSGFHERHEAFLAAALESCEVYVKVVVTTETTTAELEEVARRIAAIDAKVPLVLQPVTPMGKVRTAPSADQMLPHHRACEALLTDVRLIPQTHRVYGAL